MRFPQMPSVVAIAIAAAGSAGCRSATPQLPPETPAQASPAAAPRSAEPSAGPTRRPEAGPSQEEEAVPPSPVSEEPSEPAPGEEEPSSGETPGDPQSLQKEALELCQSAQELLDRGELEDAVAAADRAYELMLKLPADGDETYLQAKEDIRILVADLITRIYRSRRTASLAPMTSWDLALPIVRNQHVQREIESLTGVERDQLLEGYRRSGRYRPMILARLKQAGLPGQLSWLPLVESWFKVRALSRASALGMWQFISSTAVRYGLSRDAWVDERLDPEKSTEAAIAYLSELHGLFGDWPKALAAYNCGEARVLRLQRRSADEYLDFWDLYELLPRETRRYVPRLLAALQIIESPGQYGVSLPEPDAPVGDVATVHVERSVKLDHLDALLGLETDTLASLNPELRYKVTPKHAYDLKVPGGREPIVLAKIESIPEWKRPTPQYLSHRVRRGETLSGIARRYGTSVSSIMRANGLRSANRIWPGQRLRIPVQASRAARTISDKPSTRRGPRRGLSRYRVERGDTLGDIAQAHHVSLPELLRFNGLTRASTIYPGQWLVIPED